MLNPINTVPIWCVVPNVGRIVAMAGVDRAEVMPTDGNPVVYGEKIVDPAARTVLIYGHYDVMPAEPFELWKPNLLNP